MTEAEWLAWNGETKSMIDLVCGRYRASRTKSGKRKLWLFALACAHQLEHQLHDDPPVRGMFDLLDRLAEGVASADEVQ